MSATFSIGIHAIRTGTVGNLTNVVKKVEFSVKGEEQGQTFELPFNADLADPQAESFVPLAQVTQADVVAWVEANYANLDAVKAHIQSVLDREIAKSSFAPAPLPWVVATPETPPAKPE